MTDIYKEKERENYLHKLAARNGYKSIDAGHQSTIYKIELHENARTTKTHYYYQWCNNYQVP